MRYLFSFILITLFSSITEQTFGSGPFSFNSAANDQHRLNQLAKERVKREAAAHRNSSAITGTSTQRQSYVSPYLDYTSPGDAWEKEVNYNEGFFKRLNTKMESLILEIKHTPEASSIITSIFTRDFQELIKEYDKYHQAVEKEKLQGVGIAKAILPAVEKNLNLLKDVVTNLSGYDISKLSIQKITEYKLESLGAFSRSFQLFEIQKFPAQSNSASSTVAEPAGGFDLTSSSSTEVSDPSFVVSEPIAGSPPTFDSVIGTIVYGKETAIEKNALLLEKLMERVKIYYDSDAPVKNEAAIKLNIDFRTFFNFYQPFYHGLSPNGGFARMLKPNFDILKQIFEAYKSSQTNFLSMMNTLKIIKKRVGGHASVSFIELTAEPRV